MKYSGAGETISLELRIGGVKQQATGNDQQQAGGVQVARPCMDEMLPHVEMTAPRAEPRGICVRPYSRLNPAASMFGQHRGGIPRHALVEQGGLTSCGMSGFARLEWICER
jgi:hypothetical protein